MGADMGRRLEQEACDKRGVRWKLIGDGAGLFFVCPPNTGFHQRGSRRVATARIGTFPPELRGKVLDIKVDRGPENEGIGSLLLEFMEDWAKANGIAFLFGDLSGADADHFDKLRHFYEKHGYEFELYPNPGPRDYPVGQVSKWISTPRDDTPVRS